LSWIQTYTGRKFFPLDPIKEDIVIEDIAAALSKLCRFGGHCKWFYSVAEHCMLMMEQAPEYLRFAALMHDAAEAYLVDLPRPLKRHLPEYKAAEQRLMLTIAERFGFFWPNPEIDVLDARMLLTEKEQNMAPPPDKWGTDQQAEVAGGPFDIKLRYWKPEKAEQYFLEAFSILKG
jgi:uncharacterized protein